VCVGCVCYLGIFCVLILELCWNILLCVLCVLCVCVSEGERAREREIERAERERERLSDKMHVYVCECVYECRVCMCV